MSSIYERLSQERKELQRQGQLPTFMTTGGWQMFKEKYLHEAVGLKDTYMRIATTAAKHVPEEDRASWAVRFFDVLWNGWLAGSTPVLSNTGTNKGMPVSCSGAYIGDGIDEFYTKRHETAMLTKNGFGTSGYLGDIRPRGASISSGGTASGVVPVIQMFIDDMRKVAQGTSRRGAWAGYIEIEHEDFWEIVDYLKNFPDDFNLGWLFTDNFKELLASGDTEAHARWQRVLKVKMLTGKGYLVKIDEMNRHRPQCYVDHDLMIKNSNLCIEITLFNDDEHTFTCVLSSMNLSKYDEWKDTDAVFVATVFLDCIAQEFIELAREVNGMETAIRFTEKGRALGLGALGFHTYLQQKLIDIESFEAHMINIEIFQHLEDESLKASMWMAKQWGVAEWCRGTGLRNTHRLAVAPNTSSALICGGVSQGIEPIVANVYIQPTSAGEIYRMNPTLLKWVDDNVEGGWTDEMAQEVINAFGSVQGVSWLPDHIKVFFKTAFELDQRSLIRLAAARQPYVCQGQSLNLFFDSNESEEYIAMIHQEAMLNPNILGLYYVRTAVGVGAAKDTCEACSG